MKTPTPKSGPEIITIIAPVHPFTVLSDVRQKTLHQKFGHISQVARQFGINATEREGYMEFVAPKSRMQLFAEKLHFAGIRFREI